VARKLLPVHDRIHEAEEALRVVSTKDLETQRVATKIMSQARELAAPFPRLADLIDRAVRLLNGEGDARAILSGRRIAESKALILMAHDEIHTDDPHSQVDHRLN
jgi:hypothetical protein